MSKDKTEKRKEDKSEKKSEANTSEVSPDWKLLSERRWLRKKWRSSGKTGGLSNCISCKRQIHNKESYYVRPAYTDGKDWMCVRCYRDMKKATGAEMSNKYGH